MVNYKKKILFLFEDARFGGPHAQFINLCKKITINCEIDCLIPKENNKIFFFKLSRLGLKRIIQLNISWITKDLLKILKYIIFFPFFLFKLLNIFKINKYDVICIYGGSFCYQSIIAAIFSKKIIIWFIHDTYKYKWNLMFFWVVSRFVKHIVYTSFRSKKIYNKFCKSSNISVLKSAIKINKNILKKNNKLILCAGNFNKIKNFKLFLNIAKLFVDDDKIKFILAGNVWNNQNYYYKYILDQKQKMKLNNMQIIKTSNIQKFLIKSNYFILTSLYESSPLIVLEALNYNNIIFSTDVGDLKSDINKNKFGFIINKDLNKLKAKIYELIKLKKYNRELISKGKIFLAKNHNINIYAKKFIELIRNK